MAKTSGLGSALFVGQYDISGDIGAVQTDTSRSILDVTSIADSAMSRLVGLKDGTLTGTGYFNTTAGQAHPVLDALPTTDRIVSFFVGATVGNAAASVIGKQITYGQDRGQDGALGITTNVLGNGYALEWGEMLTTGLQSFATGTQNGTSIDLGSTSTAFGAAAYLHCTVMPSGTLSVAVHDSADNSSFALITGMTFTNLTGPGSERIQASTSQTVRRYVRVVCSGTHGTASVAVNFVRYTADPSV